MALGISGSAVLKSCGGQLAAPLTQATQTVSGSALAATSVSTSAMGVQAYGATNIVWIGASVAGDITSVTDSNGATYAAVLNSVGSPVSVTNGLFNLYAYSVQVTVTTSGNVVTANFSTALNSFIAAGEYPNVGNVGVVNNSATGTASTTVTLYVPQSSAVVVACAIGNATGTPGAGSGFTSQAAGSSTAMAYLVEDQMVTSYATGNAGIACAGTGLGTVWTILALAITPVVIPNSASGLNFTASFFFCQPTLQSVTQTILLAVGSFNADTVAINISSANVLQFVSNAGGTTTSLGTTLLANTWYYVAFSVTSNGGKIAVYVKKVGAATSTRTVVTASSFSTTESLIGLYFGAAASNFVGTSAETTSQYYVGIIRSFCVWPNQVLTQAELDRQSEQLGMARLAGAKLFLSFIDNAHTVDESGGSSLQMVSVNGGTLTTSQEPPLAEGSNIRRRKFAPQVTQGDVLFFNGPFATSEQEDEERSSLVDHLGRPFETRRRGRLLS